jgi:RHS repeat-associated protein
VSTHRIAAGRRIPAGTRVALIALVLVLCLVVGASPAYAATHIPTTTYTTNTTWTTANSPYVLDGDVTVAAGVTLTINPGVVVKFNGTFRELRVNGTLTAVGGSASSDHIVFTSYQDDTAGGDTNGDGSATQGAAGQWNDIYIPSGNANSHLQWVDVRYGGNGTTLFGWSNGAVKAESAGTSVTIEDSTFDKNQTSGVLVNGSTTTGATIRRSSFTNGTNGVSAITGYVKVEDNTLIQNNSQDGLFLNLASGYTGPQSYLIDSEVSSNSRDGVRLQVDPSIPTASYPRGRRNNIYNNSDKQLWFTAAKRDSDWKQNYWGDGVVFKPTKVACWSAGQNSVGKLAYTSSQADPPDGPIDSGSYVTGQTQCGYDKTAIGTLEFSKYKYRLGIRMNTGQTLGCRPHNEFAEDATAHCRQDPVNSATGSFTHEVTDLTLPGIGVPLEFTRTYNSIDTTPGPFGPGWTHSYNASLTINAGGDITARAGSGQQLEFVKNADGSFTPAAGGRATLTTVTGGYELVTYDQRHYRFDSAGKLTSLKDRNDKGLTFAYDGSGRLSTITDAANQQTTLTYNGSGLISQIAAPGSQTVSYAYTNGQLTSVTDLAGKVWTYTYEQYGFLEKEIDPLSHTIFRNVYGADGRVSEQYDALNNKTTFAWDNTTQTATITDPRNNAWKDVYAKNVLQKEVDASGKETTYTHDADLSPAAVTGPDNNTTTLTYDSRGNLTHAVAPSSLNADKTLAYDSQNNVTSVTDARGKVTTYTYDANGNNTSITQDGVTIATYTYNASGQLTTFKDGRNNTTTYTYDTNGNLTSETDELGDKTTYTYDAAGNLTSRVDPRGNVQGADPNQFKWTYTYDGAGRKLTETDPLGNVTTHAYDNAGNQTSVTDANNKTTSYTYDANNRLLTATAPDTGVTTYTYDAAGNKITETDPRNKTTTYGYDANNRLTSVTTPLGNKTTYSYDSSGNLTKQVDPRGNVQGATPDDYATTYTYDPAGRVLTKTDPLGHTTTYTYDKVGNRATVTDANNHTTSYTYNGRDLLTTVTAPGGADTTYTYDSAGNLTTRTDPKTHQTTYAYDGANRLTSMTLPLSRQWTYAYDAAGNRTQVVDANGNSTQTAGDGTTTYSYDRAGRLTGIDYSDSTPDVTYSYDRVGNRTQMTDGATQTYSYDSVNRLTQVTRGTDTFAYTYDLAGNLTRRTYPDSTIVDYTYDDDSRLATVSNGGQTTTYGYDAAASLTQTTLPSGNGYTEDRTYDRAGRLTRVKTSKTGSTLADFTYTLDPVGNPTQVVRDGNLPGTTTYTYDARDRLTEVCFQSSCPGGTDPFIRWTYDSVGNRLSETRPSGTTNYSYDAADQLTAAGTTSYSYDENGNETAAGSQSFSYDLANRTLTSSSGGTTTTYAYDGDGNRTQVVVGGQTTKYLWDTNGSLPQIALERDGNNVLLRRYVYGARRISMSSGAATYYFHYDRTDSTSNVTSSTGTTEWTYAYEPFGATNTETQNDPSAPQNALKFSGQLADSNGLYYLRAREYSPAQGRFLAHDPAETSTSHPAVSTYAYALDRPTVLRDPTGMCAESATPSGVARHFTSFASDEEAELVPPCGVFHADIIGGQADARDPELNIIFALVGVFDVRALWYKMVALISNDYFAKTKSVKGSAIGGRVIAAGIPYEIPVIDALVNPIFKFQGSITGYRISKRVCRTDFAGQESAVEVPDEEH